MLTPHTLSSLSTKKRILTKTSQIFEFTSIRYPHNLVIIKLTPDLLYFTIPERPVKALVEDILDYRDLIFLWGTIIYSFLYTNYNHLIALNLTHTLVHCGTPWNVYLIFLLRTVMFIMKRVYFNPSVYSSQSQYCTLPGSCLFIVVSKTVWSKNEPALHADLLDTLTILRICSSI